MPALRSPRLLGWLFAVLCAAGGTALRVGAALADENFDPRSPVGMLKSDPGLLYYFTERIVEAGGLPPEDFRADPRVEHPTLVDVPARFAVGQEFVVAWGHRLFGGEAPLHVSALWIMAAWASLTVIGVYGLALELTGSALWAALAAALHAAMPASYRTVGWILMNEDFSVPWFALHLYLLARAARVRTAASVLLASLALGTALSTWHATSFLLAIEVACVLAWFLRTGRNPFEVRAAWILPVAMLAFATLVPVLRGTAFALSLPMQMIGAMAVAALVPRAAGRAVAVAAWIALGAAAWLDSRATGGGIGEYGHVFALLAAKVRHLGVLPDDPGSIPIDARMMWQGPFATLEPLEGLRLLGVGALAILPAFALVRRGTIAGLVGAFAALALALSWLVERTVILPGLLLPVVGAVALAGVSSRPRLVAGLAAAAVLLQGILGTRSVLERPIAWYLPAQRQAEIRALVAAIPALVPPGEAIAADFVNSTAILAHTGHPILFQPKWESRESRERAAAFLTMFFHGSPAAMRQWLRERYDCRYVVFDRYTLGILRASRYAAGLPAAWDGPVPGTCAAAFLEQDQAPLESVPGYRLLYRSPAGIVQSDNSPADFFRLYELGP